MGVFLLTIDSKPSLIGKMLRPDAAYEPGCGPDDDSSDEARVEWGERVSEMKAPILLIHEKLHASEQ